MIWFLLVMFQIKHFIADYLLQNSYMLGKFKKTKWVLPLAAHCGVHAVYTFIIALSVKGLVVAAFCATLDFVLHFVMDRIKASPNLLGKYQSLSKGEFTGLLESRVLCVHGMKVADKPDLVAESKRRLDEIDARFKSNTKFWYALGLDQTVHHLTHYVIIYILLM